MNTSDGAGGEQRSQQDGQAAPADLIDFYLRWRSEFRQTATALSRRSDLAHSELQTIHWMILVLDRISEHDLEPLKRPID